VNKLAAMRIVSLLASATEIVCALGAGDMLVGRSHECDNPDWVRRLPACSEPAFDVSVSSGAIDAEVRRRIAAGEELYRVRGGLIRELRPDLVLAQAHCEVCAVTPGDIERSGACLPTLALSASTIEGVFGSIGQVAGRIGLDERAH
jgi:iron complex transport system substrate-binding protein